MNSQKINTKYDNDAKKIVEIIGKDNFLSITHCQTRLRIVLKDSSNVDVAAIDELDSVKGTFTQQGQFQIIIGPNVKEFFFYINKYIDIKKSSKEETKLIAKKQANKFQKAMTTFSEIFIPLIPVIVAGGLILALRNLLELDWTGDGAIAIEHSEFAKQLDNWLWLPAQAVFWYLPVHVVWSMFNRKNKTPALGIAIGIMLVAPGTLVNMYDVSDAINNIYVPTFYVGVQTTNSDPSTWIYVTNSSLIPVGYLSYGPFAGGVYTPEQIATWNIPGISDTSTNKEIVNALNAVGITGSYEIEGIFDAVNALDASYFTDYWPFAISYVGQVIPALLVGWFAVWFYEFVEDHTIPSVKYVWPPFITILVVQVVALGIVAPIGAILGFAISFIFGWAFSNSIAKFFFAPLFGLLYPVLVITGLHHTLNAVMIQLTTTGTNYVFPMVALSNMAQGASVFAVVYILQKDAKIREQGTSAGITCWLGVTEPAMYGINLRFMFPFVAAMIGSAVGCTFSVSCGITANGIGMGGILGFLNVDHSSFDAQWLNWPVYILIMIGTVVLTYFLTILLSKKSSWFAKFSSENWIEHLKKVDENLEKNVLNITRAPYLKTFTKEEQEYYLDFLAFTDSYANIKLEIYKLKDKIKLDKKNKNIKKDFLKNEEYKLKENTDLIKLIKKALKRTKKLQMKLNKEIYKNERREEKKENKK
ncbi:MAG: hypothetical protein HPAVJP_3950 [Candidatus Hepatoplasma vulgare]|nr:MAG: hypothetical protein HPAVJP_3950 [Candidatus Hepatoplasma sp.]